MQRMPTRNIEKGVQGRRPESEASPMQKLARRIREEQGTEQVKAFLAAMGPFSAPNEIKRIGEDFGISYESIESFCAQKRYDMRGREESRQPQASASTEPLNMLKTIMQLRSLLGAGSDPGALMNMLRAAGKIK